MNDQVRLSGHDRDDAGIRRESRLEREDGLHPLERGQFHFQPLVDRHVAGDRPDRPRAHAEVAGRCERSFHQSRMRGQAQVVVRGEVDQLRPVDHDLGRLRRRQHAKRTVEV
jgi:hypothetical protein